MSARGRRTWPGSSPDIPSSPPPSPAGSRWTGASAEGTGEYLLMDALRRALQASREVASVAVVVDVKDDNAVAFYRRYEFIPRADRPTRLFLPMGTIERLFA